MKLSIVCATYNRGPLLERALETYSKQTLDPNLWEYVLAEDMSTDNTLEVCERYKDRINLRVLDAAKDLGLPKEPGKWRDGCKLRNAASTFAFGEVMISTHPEIMVPPNALELAYKATIAEPEKWHTAIPYWLPPGDYDAVDWKNDLKALNTIPGFYDPSWPSPIEAPGAIDYRNQNQEVRNTWESEVWWAMTMKLWRWLGGFHEHEQWGSPDLTFLSRRHFANIKTNIIKDGDHSLMVYHQDHPSPRDMDLAMDGARETRYTSQQNMREQGGLYPVYYHGHRERAVDGKLEGIMHDHIQRYEWAAAQIPAGAKVLDVGCGTGYGSKFFEHCTYVGVDADAESIQWAKEHYSDGEFLVADADDLPFEKDEFDAIVCFEVLEHVQNQYLFEAMLDHVLKPGGKLYLSTPQKGATEGTKWDRYMLTHNELNELFLPWETKPFYQLRYGTSIVQEGTPPADAEIQLIIGE